MKIITKFIIPLLFLSLELQAQGVDDAIYHAQKRYEGTAGAWPWGLPPAPWAVT